MKYLNFPSKVIYNQKHYSAAFPFQLFPWINSIKIGFLILKLKTNQQKIRNSIKKFPHLPDQKKKVPQKTYLILKWMKFIKYHQISSSINFLPDLNFPSHSNKSTVNNLQIFKKSWEREKRRKKEFKFRWKNFRKHFMCYASGKIESKEEKFFLFMFYNFFFSLLPFNVQGSFSFLHYWKNKKIKEHRCLK